ncbi:hypothetical protein GH714_010462 [Hevea brasiliensis]|uniref:F-box associated domain-containing protein n=1 Tax=Hevea brasiliensis TaxID=3981 RepID=A0A6A6N269_HEVBR|nr:hypothetical protein GH714_010462 [Hevea brasiliensis]
MPSGAPSPHKPFVDTVESVYDCFTGKRILRSNKFSTDAFGSCNGLLAMYNGGGMSLWNPSTKKHQILPKFWSHDEYNRRDKILVGFGYDSINNDYKVIMMFQRKDLNNYYIPCNGDSGVAVSGSLHWVVSNMVDDMLLAFDLGNEKFCELPKPEIKKRFVLAELGGSLALSYSCMGTDVDVMKQYGITASWTKLFHKNHGISDLYTSDLKPLFYSKTGNGVLLNHQYGKYSILYDSEQKSAKRVIIFGSPERESEIAETISVNICVRSLVPVHFNSGIAGSPSELQSKKSKRISTRENKEL